MPGFDWKAALASGVSTAPVLAAHTFVNDLGSRMGMVSVVASDERYYGCKNGIAGRSVVAEHVVGRLGSLLGAPVPPVALIDFDDELLDLNRELGHFKRGRWHGSRWLLGLTDALPLQHEHEPENRDRLARLCVLYSWVHAADYQFMYRKAAPNQVWSVDHGEFLPGGSAWSIATLAAAAGKTPSWDGCLASCNFSKSELRPAGDALAAVSEPQIVDILAGIPKNWGCPLSERVALAEYLITRRDQMGLLLAKYRMKRV